MNEIQIKTPQYRVPHTIRIWNNPLPIFPWPWPRNVIPPQKKITNQGPGSINGGNNSESTLQLSDNLNTNKHKHTNHQQTKHCKLENDDGE